MTLKLDRSFDVDYDVESRIDMPSVLDYGFHEHGMVPKPDLLLRVTPGDGSWWTAECVLDLRTGRAIEKKYDSRQGHRMTQIDGPILLQIVQLIPILTFSNCNYSGLGER